MRKRLSVTAALFAAILSPAAHATTFFWDTDGDTSTATGGTGIWDTSSLSWRPGSLTGSPLQAWVDGNDADFDATAGTVTIPDNQTRSAGTLTFSFNTGNYVITGGTALNLTNPAQSVVMPVHTNATLAGQVINANLTGADLTIYNPNTVAGGGRSLLNLGGVNAFTGNLILDGAAIPSNANANSSNMVSLSGTGQLPSTATVVFKRNWSQFLFTAGTAAGGSNTPYTATIPNDFNLNGSGTSTTLTSIIGASAQGTVVTLTGSLSGNAHLNYQVGTNGGQGVIILNPTTSNTYTGETRILSNTNGLLRIGKDDALPTGTTLVFGGTAGNDGSFDLNGHNQTVAGLSSITAAGTGANQAYIGGVVNNTSSLATLTIDGSLITKYDGPIGTPPPTTTVGTTTLTFNANLPTASANIALHLAPTNTGTLILTNANNAPFSPGSDYTGGTVIDGGRLIAANTVGSATGAGPVTIGPAGTLGSGGGNNGTIAGHVTSAGTVAAGIKLPLGLDGTVLPSGSTTSSIGTLTLSGGLTAQAGSNLNFEIGSSGNDQVVLGGATDADILSLPATPQSVNVNLFDQGMANNTTYTLVSYPASTTLPGLDTSAAGPLKIVRPTSGLASLATFTLSNNTAAHTIELSVSGTFGRQISWRGDASATGSGTWDVNATSNFDLAGSPSAYLDPDEVTFDELTTPGADPVVVDIAPAGVTPANVIVTNTTRTYTLQGGPIKNGSVTKNGTGTLVLAGSNSYAAGTFVNAGVLEIASDASLGAVPASPTVNVSLFKSAANGASTLRFDGDTTLNANRNILLTTTNGGGPIIDTNSHNVTIAGQVLSGSTGGVNLVKVGAGTLALTGDNSTAAGGGSIAAILVNGGTVQASQDVNLGKPGGGITLNGGGLKFAASFNPADRNFNISAGGGTIDTNGFNATINDVVAGTGVLTKTGAGTLTLSGANTLTGTTVVNGGSLVLRPAAWAPVLTSAGGADLQSGKLVFDYASTSSPQSTVVPLLKSAHDASNFATGQLFTSNTPDPNHGLGYRDDGSSQLTVMYTWYGDANLDGTVNADDYALLDRAAAKGLTPSWSNGDFNYDGVLNSDDYLAIDTSFAILTGQLSPSFLSMRESQFGPTYVSTLLASVPEPSLTLFAACGLALLPLTRRRHTLKIRRTFQ